MQPDLQYHEVRSRLWQTCLVGGVGGLRLNHLDGSIEVFKGNEVKGELPPFFDASPLPCHGGLPAHTTHEPPALAFMPAAVHGPPPPPPKRGLPPPPPGRLRSDGSDISVSTVLPPSEAEMSRTDRLLHCSELQLHTLSDEMTQLAELAKQELRAGRRLMVSVETCSTERGGQLPQNRQQQQAPPPPPPLVEQLDIPESLSRITEDAPHDAATTKAHEYVKGDTVMVDWYGSWEPGWIHDASPDGLFTVRWETPELTHDVAANRLRLRLVSNTSSIEEV